MHGIETPENGARLLYSPDGAAVRREVYSGRRHTARHRRCAQEDDDMWTQAIVLSNRGPISHDIDDSGSLRMRRSSGGLVTALDPLVQACSATWVACGTRPGDAHPVALGG